jgi:hypothetical protein
MPAVIWPRYFMDAQGYGIQENIVYQDNQSTILIEKNGKASSSKRTKHISIRYYFVTDRINKNELTVEWCPTGDMIGDYMTKPNQGALFRKFRDQLMGVVAAKDPGPGKVTKGKPLKATRDNKRNSKNLILAGQKAKSAGTQECVGQNGAGYVKKQSKNGPYVALRPSKRAR